MYVIAEIQGQQFKVEEGKKLYIHHMQNVETGASLPVTVDFKHYLDENGEAQELADSLAQELVVSFESETGTFDDTELTTTQQVATTNYNVVSGLNNLTVKSSDAIVSREFGNVKLPDKTPHVLKALFPIDINDWGNDTEVILVDRNAKSPINSTPSGITKAPESEVPVKALFPID